MFKDKLLIIKTIVISLLVAFVVFYYINNYFYTRDFINQGKRFTAEDGQVLCLRIKHLESLVDKNINISCDYNK